MTTTVVHRVFSPLKRVLPDPVHGVIRSLVTAFATPIRFSILGGHFKSSLKRQAVTKEGHPIPWYTYPAIDFLRFRDFSRARVLEFGAGQSTSWWSDRAASVVSFEGDPEWFASIRHRIGSNVHLYMADMQTRESCESGIRAILHKNEYESFDVAIIDGLYREQMVSIALDVIDSDGIIVVDNSDGYEIYDRFVDSDLLKVDFYGYAPGVFLPHCTSIYFSRTSPAFSAKVEIRKIALVD